MPLTWFKYLVILFAHVCTGLKLSINVVKKVEAKVLDAIAGHNVHVRVPNVHTWGLNVHVWVVKNSG